ncbi:arsenate reductase family protein [Tunicatimonas pelagia]|uniref:arsenate reductase family protein n=1 Tax=Tunicatimonas pelagia TaxID=931531 RepID=UPI0026670C93|nr:ArsC/Spx/MgsR family protein [Tunicatimonas pelagia]WKN45684.1 ArsC/Spx/MgsR family protein [Tunicatimonas pelagia]
MEWNPKEIELIYNFNNQGDREALAYAKQIAQHVNETDISKTPLTERQMAQLLDNLSLGVDDVIDRRADIYQEKYDDAEMSKEDWLEVLKHNPELMRTPIGILGNRAIICETPNDLLKLDDGQGFDQNMKT